MIDLGTFATEINDNYPIKNVIKNRSKKIETPSPYQKLKQIKEKARTVEKTFYEQMSSHHKIQKSLEEVTKKSLIKRIQFLKIYGNKKSKYQHRELLQSKRRDDEIFQRKSLDLVKRRKLQNELHHILLQNEEEEHIYRLQSQNKKNKQHLKKQIQLTNEREQSLKHHDIVKKGNTQFLIRKKNIQTSISMRSKHNYFNKVNHELTMIKQYEEIMNQIESFATLDESKCNNESTLYQTLDPNSKTFLTNNTIQVV